MMSLSHLVVATFLCFSLVHGHYIFQTLTIDGQKSQPNQYVRKNTNNNSPVTDLSSPDLRCNVGGATGGSTQTADVRAGATLGFVADQAVYHQGPVTFYMTKVPSASAADGSTPWFKIAEIGPKFSGNSAQWELSQSYSAKIPSCLPAGEYLLRVEQLALHNPGAPPQFYIGCGQIKVTGGGNATPGPLTPIPGHVKASDPGYTVNIYNNFASYTVPGPKVFQC
ncbi:glycoside hydrolase family 61 protein [Eremomyces bilateralis CBS 781.70]|uniref:AA9 family lytic polysaccharide monooxygenase n=1 Tax=Eremomyces bilateralis CBS 781.70 TaxID=1392243 RepID=A0A6G1G480_9PEZI|nr:glycoside hydrolase family 61 protein [Eremomyces bilateralis CBS 781.70]KAF1812716.1 glycoside hydrolase family 61 protein [Eremomyces bilateralis CBS 781.70]